MLNIFKYYILSVLMGVTIIQAQPTYFNEVYNPDSTWSAGLSICNSSEGYLGCGISGSPAGYYQIALSFLDQNGALINSINYGENGIDYYPGGNGSFKKDSNGGYYLFGGINPPGFNQFAIFMRFTSSGDSILSEIYSAINSPLIIGRNCFKTGDEGYILVADEYFETEEISNLCIIKTDSLGNEMWRSYFGSNEWEYGSSIIQTTDLGYVVGGKSLTPGIEESDDPMIYKTDSLGNLEWSLNLGGPYKDDKAMVCNTHDSCIMVLTAYADSMYTSQFAYARINLIKIDLDGDTIWNKKYGPSKPINFISNIILKPSGGFLLCGHSMIEPTVPHAGWIMEVDSTGDSLWYRDYYYYPSGPDQSLNYLYDLSITSDNGIVGVGQAYTAYPPNNTQKMWVLKVDSIGCEFPNCWVGIEEHGSTVAREPGDIAIYPNPARDEVTIALGNDKVGGMEEVRIYNSMGILLKKHRPDKQPEFSMDVSGLPAGIYFVRVRGSNNASCVRKLLIGR